MDRKIASGTVSYNSKSITCSSFLQQRQRWKNWCSIYTHFNCSNFGFRTPKPSCSLITLSPVVKVHHALLNRDYHCTMVGQKNYFPVPSGLGNSVACSLFIDGWAYGVRQVPVKLLKVVDLKRIDGQQYVNWRC